MFERAIVLLTPVLIFASTSLGQFFDDFEGDALAPHWKIWTTPEHLTHHVSGGMLHVTDLPLPSIPHSPTNNAVLHATFPALIGDVSARAVVGWDAGSLRRLHWYVSSAEAVLAEMTYGEMFPGGPALRIGSGSGTIGTFSPPAPGMHEFALSREGSTMRAYLDGALLTSFPVSPSVPVSRVDFVFVVAYPNDGMQPMRLDMVEVIPAPAGTLALLFLAILGHRSRRS